MSSTTSIPTLTLAAAKAATQACEAKANEIGVPMNIAIVDSTTHLLQFHRMPNAKLTSIPISMDKAFTAAGHGLPTSAYREAVWPGGPAYGINGTHGGRFSVIGGGVPIRGTRGEVLGAVGCSTGTPAQDEVVARAGVEVVERMVREEEEEGSKVKAKLENEKRALD
ncbi:hypothetical protein VMCG_04000 [Cytospora schulzeri]|uniref:DUF336-domain-containing protein n=1 Tax=Cytospora schulzeri TaxID=448051 RepID=A0A423WTR9_9PEZI|nr:hypothetical protein VMCG_04000 [Valsa malicola]